MITAPGHIRRAIAWRLAAAGVTLLTLVLAGVPAAAAGRSQVTKMAAAHVPWHQAGPGWAVVEYSTASTSGSAKGATKAVCCINHPWDYRYDMTGHLQATLARGTFLNWLLDAPDGTFILAGTFSGIDLISNAGHVTRRIRIPVTKPASKHVCGPVRWWSRTTLLADCFDLAPYNTDRLWLVPMRGGPPKPLTPALRAHGLFQGYIDAWRLPSGLYLEADNAHDTPSIVRQSPDGAEHTIHIPGPAGVSDFINTALGSRLLINSGLGVTNTSSLFWYNPATHAIHYVFQTPPQIRGVFGVVTFGSQGDG
jgi:hypothetical protein